MGETLIDADVRRVIAAGTPAALVSCSDDGVPNTTVISQVYYVDERHVALSFQFFSKTIRNVRENPNVCVSQLDLETGAEYVFKLRYLRSETEGDLFDEMDMQLEAIASATGMSGIFKLKGADIYEVLDVDRRGGV